jgi:Uncharacterized protein conserved in bacteria
MENLKKKLICRIDCTAQPDDGSYFEIGDTKITESAAGRYREASQDAHSRFGYRVKLNDAAKPHLLVVKYPDDKRRFLCINDGTSYDLTTGVACGGRNQPSGKMLTIENYFWARWTDESVVFSTWGKGEPAAVSEFEIYELDSLPDAELEAGVEKRCFGLQYEDPCNIGESEGAKDHVVWSRHISEYMKFSGQNLLVYPINWYHGPVIPVKSQPCERWNTFNASDRKLYWRSTLTPPDWLDTLLSKFDKDGLDFIGSMTLLRLGRLMKGMNNDLDAIKKGADTYNNMLFDDNVQSSCNDWTQVYNPIIYPEIPAAFEHGGWPAPAYGEKRTSSIGAPIFNPLHPEVRSQIEEYIGEIAAKYAAHPSFKGLAINFWHATIMWFGTLKAGYDDYTINLFEKETGIKLDIDPAAPDRFSQRYKRLTGNCRPAFITWRCKKVKEFICRCRDILTACRPDLTLTLTVWNETSAWAYLGGIGIDTQYGTRISNYELYREGGLDIKTFVGEPNIEVAVENNSMRDRGWDTAGVDSLPENSHMFSDFAFLDQETQASLASLNGSTSFIFNCWVEAWGKHNLFNCETDDPNLKEIHNLPDYDAEFVLRENSSYDDDPTHKFWFDSQLRITSALPPEPYFMELIANEVAVHDSLSITEGGLYLDKAHAIAQLEFARAYRKLPRRKFKTLNGTGDPVVVRWLYDGGKTYIYAVNREPYEVKLKIDFENGYQQISADIGAFKLFVRVIDGSATPCGYSASVPESAAQEYKIKCERVLTAIETAKQMRIAVPGCAEIADGIKKALGEGKYAYVRHALSSYAIEKTLKETELQTCKNN